MPLRLQLWSWNYEPEPTAMGPIAALWAREMAARGHSVEVVAAHPHYPPDVWPQRRRPYREVRAGVRVLRLPLWIGHKTALQRVREEVTYSLAVTAALPFTARADVIVAVSPAFLALAPIMASAKIRRIPWILWLQDLVPAAATTTGLLKSGTAVTAARTLERAAYKSATHIVTISDAFRDTLGRGGVPRERVTTIYNPATLPLATRPRQVTGPHRILCMGNIGHSQGLVDVVRVFQTMEAAKLVKLVIVGHGELADAVRTAARSENIEVLGLVDGERLKRELDRATVGLVSQRADIEEFNVPSKLMNLMGQGIPVWAHVAGGSETARIVSASGGGWVSDSADPEAFEAVLTRIVEDEDDAAQRGERALAFARLHFHPTVFCDRFERVVEESLELRRRISAEPES